MKTKYFTKCQEFDVVPKVDDFKCVEEEIDEKLEDGGKLLCNLTKVNLILKFTNFLL